MGKKKNKNKISGALKTANKTEKKIANRLKKELANLGEEDIAKVIAELEREEAKRTSAKEQALAGSPSPRAHATLTAHPTNNELILFGGEFHDGQKTVVYNDLLFYNTVSNTWRKLKAPGAPPPRSAHQAVATSADKGQLWVFGGEFTSPSETQFHHYKDLWCFSLAEKKWEKVVAPNGPSARSGHRMVLLGHKLVIFGGYQDDGRECRYFNDLYYFCLDTRTWNRIVTRGRGPCARSACVMLPIGRDSLAVYGGYSRVREGRKEQPHTHADMFVLSLRGALSTGEELEGIWREVSGGEGPQPRAGLSAAVVLNVKGNKGYVFGGIADVEETEEDIQGEMSDDLHLLDLETCRWHNVFLRSEQQQLSGAHTQIDTTFESQHTNDAVTVVTDEVFTLSLGGGAKCGPAASTPAAGEPSRAHAPSLRGPSPRMSAMMATLRSVLYVYGGVLEKDEKQFYLSDMYSLDLHKLNEWKMLIKQPKLPDWLGSDSEDESDLEEQSSESTDSSDEYI